MKGEMPFDLLDRGRFWSGRRPGRVNWRVVRDPNRDIERRAVPPPQPSGLCHIADGLRRADPFEGSESAGNRRVRREAQCKVTVALVVA
jgi:hypothetical protein